MRCEIAVAKDSEEVLGKIQDAMGAFAPDITAGLSKVEIDNNPMDHRLLTR
jgi:hypothetical protein